MRFDGESYCAGGILDELNDAVINALRRLHTSGTLPLADEVDEDALLQSADLGRWIPHIGKAGHPALGKSVERLVGTCNKRADVEFLISCESFCAALLILASDADLYWDGISKASTPEELLDALPPEELELDCVGKA